MQTCDDAIVDDPEFLAGLDAILAPLRTRGATSDELAAVTARARSFYAAQRPTPPPPPPPAEPAYPSSFTALASLIASGAPIPGIKQIPERINDAAPATPQLAGRVPGAGKKPWEREVNGGAEAETEEVFPPRIRYIFGYGSLIWKPPPHAIRRQPGYIKGFVRRFAQSSSDHRGTPESPGRVVTLVPSDRWRSLAPEDVTVGADDRVWGVCYEIDPAYAVEVRAYLDHREKDGYSVAAADIWHDDEVVIPQATVYVGHPDNPSFVGPSPLPTLAKHIHASVGPSGANKDYLFHLATAVRELDPASEDGYLMSLEREVRALDA